MSSYWAPRQSIGLRTVFLRAKAWFGLTNGALAVSAAVLISLLYFTLCSVLPADNIAKADPVLCSQPHAVVTCLSLTTSGSPVTLGGTSIAPTPAGTFASAQSDVTVKTNAPNYNLSLSTNSTVASSQNLTSGSNNIPATAGTFSSKTALANNTWGFTLTASPAPGDAVWSKVPVSGGDITLKSDQASDDTVGDTTSIFYGTKVDTGQPSGTYTATVVYTAVSNSFPSPTITSLSPNTGSTAGGTNVTIAGTNFYDTSSVTIGGTACASYTVNSPTSITCTTPAHAAGTVDVTVTTAHGTSANTASDDYTYETPITVTFVSPEIASTTPGTESGPAFSIAGTNFTGATAVTIGGNACASFTVVSDSLIECTGPNSALSTGAKSVVVSKSGQSSNTDKTIAYNTAAYPTLQSGSAYANCSTTATIFRDTRDSQLYYVKKMQDNKCWMVDNLKYVDRNVANTADGTTGMTLRSSGYNTVDGSSTQSTANSDKAFYNTPMGTDYCKGTTNMPTNTVTRCGYLYNWYAATGGTGTYTQSTDGNQVSGNICPANFRLPSGKSGTGSPTTNGTTVAVADFPVLSASMKFGYSTTGDINSTYYAGWQPSGAWSGVFSGYRASGAPASQSTNGYYWSSTAYSSTHAHYLSFNSTNAWPIGDTSGNDKWLGFAARCVMDAPPTPPAGTNPPNISSTNPAALDVYPTTGWAGDTVAITSNALFTNVESVTIGGTACTEWGAISSSLISCKLPAKTAGTTNDIVVINSGTNVTNAATYNHMKITYFNPSSSTVTVNGTTYNYYPNGFTSANCTSLTASNSTSLALPNSIAYVRDTRNNQTYKVKRMIDNKCWMIDNLKYIGPTMTFNNGDHRNNGGFGADNTVDESSTQSAANYDKAFYNNPMSTSYCYGSSGMSAQTLTNCGYFYNWYAATNGTGTYAQSTMGNQVSGNICPANFRLPSASSGTGGPTTNGIVYTHADFPVLNASMNAGSLVTGATNSEFYAGWWFSGAWPTAFSGVWSTGLVAQGGYGQYWSSTVRSGTNAEIMYISNSLAVYLTSGKNKTTGLTIRCLIGP